MSSDFAGLPVNLTQMTKLNGLDSEIGDRLLTGVVRERWAASLAVAEAKKLGLRLRLHLADRQVAGVAWEAARVGDKWPALLPQTPIVRYVPAARTSDVWEERGPLRLLVIMVRSEELGLPALGNDAERSTLAEALAPLEANGKLSLHWLEGIITRRAVLDAMRRFQPHLLHFVGHGYYDEEREEGGLYLAKIKQDYTVYNNTGQLDPISANEWGVLLAGSSLRFALLNACDSGRAIGGVAEALVKSALPAVLGLQATINDTTAIRFAGAFYRAIADHWPIDAATAEARRLLSLEIGLDSPEWALPILYMRAEEGRLFG